MSCHEIFDKNSDSFIMAKGYSSPVSFFRPGAQTFKNHSLVVPKPSKLPFNVIQKCIQIVSRPWTFISFPHCPFLTRPFWDLIKSIFHIMLCCLLQWFSPGTNRKYCSTSFIVISWQIYLFLSAHHQTPFYFKVFDITDIQAHGIGFPRENSTEARPP